MFFGGRWIIPVLLVVLFVKIGWAGWWMLAFFWLFPMFFGGWRGHSWGCWSSFENEEEKRKRKNDELYDFNPPMENRRRLIRTSDGEILTAVEDPQTGILILEE